MDKIITNYSFVTVTGIPSLKNLKAKFVSDIEKNNVSLIGEVRGDCIVTSQIIKVDTRMKYVVTQLGSKYFLGAKSIEYDEYIKAIKNDIPILEEWEYKYEEREKRCIFKGMIDGIEKETSVVNFIEDKNDGNKNGFFFLFDNEKVFVNWGNPHDKCLIDESFLIYAGRKIKPKFY